MVKEDSGAVVCVGMARLEVAPTRDTPRRDVIAVSRILAVCDLAVKGFD